jgi:hypothetical protein
MNTARRTFFLPAAAVLLALAGCAKGSTSIDEDLTKAQGGPLGADDLCGNGLIDEEADEECDPGNANSKGNAAKEKLGRATCESLGFSAGGSLTCDPETCIYDTSLCKLPPVQMNTGGGGG